MKRSVRARSASVVTLALVGLTFALTACDSSSSAATTTPGSPQAGATGTATSAASSSSAAGSRTHRNKVMIVLEENEDYGTIVGSPRAPRINDFAKRFGLATNVQAGYPVACPSLPGYLILTSGSQHGVCDDRSPAAHPISGDNLYKQVADAGMQYRQYAESMPKNCARKNTSDERYLVRHAPAPYYVSEQQRCQQWDVPMGTATSGALHDAVRSGTLPQFSFLTPDACNDMHGASACGQSGKQLITTADTWLGTWMDQVMAGPDYKSGKLTIIITWDEGSNSTNHLPVIVISPKTSSVRTAAAYTHCSTLRTMEDLLGVAPLGCAATAPSMVRDFRLA